MKPVRLGVNIDHVATIRNARGGIHPDPVQSAKLAQFAGADGITAHLREDRRHISDNDIYRLKKEINLPLNLEMAATDEMLEIALKTKPNAACIVPEKRTEVTTEGGLDVIFNQTKFDRQYTVDFFGGYSYKMPKDFEINKKPTLSIVLAPASTIDFPALFKRSIIVICCPLMMVHSFLFLCY